MSRNQSQLLDETIGIPIETIEGSNLYVNSETDELDRILQGSILNEQDPLPVDIDEFFKLFKTVIEAKLTYENNTGNVLVTRSYPDQEQLQKWNELIVYKLNYRSPARVDQSSIRERGKVIPLTPIQRQHNVPDPDYPGYTINVYEYRYENEIELTCWSRNCEEADFRARWLEDTMLDLGWYFSASGIDAINYIDRSADKESLVQPGELKFSGCPLNYWVRTKKLYKNRSKTITEIKTILQISGEIASD
jgi:hypothetical protein